MVKHAKVTPAGGKRPDWLVRLPEAQDEKILSAAFDAFAARGFDGATMNEIATAAGVSKRTIYERYRDKADMFRALLAWGCRQNLPEEISEADDSEAALVSHARAVLAAMMRPESVSLTRIVIGEAGRFPELGKLFDEMTRGPSVRIVEELARRLAKAGRIALPRGSRFADDFIGLLRGDLWQRVLVGAAEPLAQEKVAAEAKRCVALLLKAYE